MKRKSTTSLKRAKLTRHPIDQKRVKDTKPSTKKERVIVQDSSDALQRAVGLDTTKTKQRAADLDSSKARSRAVARTTSTSNKRVRTNDASRTYERAIPGETSTVADRIKRAKTSIGHERVNDDDVPSALEHADVTDTSIGVEQDNQLDSFKLDDRVNESDTSNVTEHAGKRDESKAVKRTKVRDASTNSEWEWTPERERCLELFLRGLPKTNIATHIEVNRNTVTAWCKEPAFLQRASELQLEHERTVRQRRIRETTRFTDKVSQLANKALDTAIAHPNSVKARYRARDWAAEYRSWRNEERIDTGENIQRHQHDITGHVEHQHAVASQSFKGFLTEAIDDGVIDAEIVEGDDAQEVLIGAVRQLLAGSDLVDELNDEP